MGSRRIKGLTLIELIVAIGITALLAGVVMLMLKTGFESYFFAQKEILLEKALDECLSEITGGSFERYGIKDALEILEATPAAISFTPLWVDDAHSIIDPARPIILNRSFKAGSAIPIAEVLTEKKVWRQVPITFVLNKVFLNAPVEPGSKLRLVFHPDASYSPDCAMTIAYKDARLTRAYQGKTEIIPKYNIPGVVLTDFKISYFDNTNAPVLPQPEQIPNITALKVELTAAFSEGKAKKAGKVSKTASIFINLRNTRPQGGGVIIKEGTRLKIPDSKQVRVFSLSHIAGIKEGGLLELEARPQSGTTWKVSIELGSEGSKAAIKKYSVEYPPGAVVYSQAVNLSPGEPLNFMNLGATGRYDYDFDKDGNNVVNLEGDVELCVTRMDAAGARLFIRP